MMISSGALSRQAEIGLKSPCKFLANKMSTTSLADSLARNTLFSRQLQQALYIPADDFHSYGLVSVTAGVIYAGAKRVEEKRGVLACRAIFSDLWPLSSE